MSSNFRWCDVCDTHHREGERCYPVYRVYGEDEGVGDAIEIGALAAEYAAEKWAELNDANSAEYMIVSGRSEPVITMIDTDGRVTKWRVCGEAVPQYSAKEVKGESK